MTKPKVRRAHFSIKNVFRKLKNGYGYLQFQYYDPIKNANAPLPLGLPVDIVYVDAGGVETSRKSISIGDKQGKVSFKIADYLLNENNKYITFEFPIAPIPDDRKYLNVGKRKLMTQKELDDAIAANPLYLTKEMLFILPRSMALKNAAWDINCPLYKADKYYFEVPFEKALKTDSNHVPVVLKPEWQYLSLRYKEPFTAADVCIPQFIMVEGYNDGKPAARSNVYHKNCILLPWILSRDMAVPPAGTAARTVAKITLKFQTKDAFVSPKKKIMIEAPATIWKKPLKERYKYFDLPEKWESANWVVQINTDKKIFLGHVNAATTAAKPMEIYLDSVTLTNAALQSAGWNAANRFATFNLALQLQNADTANKRPYWNKDTFPSNCLLPDANDKLPRRVVAFDGGFYDVTHKRSKTGDVIGARAAVLNDPDVHHGEAVLAPVVAACGNFDLHCFGECLRSAGKGGHVPATYLLVYWSGTIDDTNAPGKDEDFFQHGFTNAKGHWEKKAYVFRPQKDPQKADLTVYPLFYFEGRSGNPKKCEVILYNPNSDDRSDMGQNIAHFHPGRAAGTLGAADAGMDPDYQPAGAAANDIPSTMNFRPFTMAHELGHALGLDDEYLESNAEDSPANATQATDTWWNPVLPFGEQYYPGMPYSVDEGTIMAVNRAPRLRHFWYFCRWLNTLRDHPDVKVNDLVSDTTFRVKGTWGGTKTKYNYFLEEKAGRPDRGVNFYKPYYQDKDFPQNANAAQQTLNIGCYDGAHRPFAPGGRVDLFLYKMGQDETCDLIMKNKVPGFDGILVVRTRVLVRFQDYTVPLNPALDDKWPNDLAIATVAKQKLPEQLRWLRRFQTRLNSDLNLRFYLAHKYDSLFHRIYVYFVPHYVLDGQAGATAFTMTVQRNTTATLRHEADFKAAGFTNNVFTIDQKQNPITVMRYMLGLKPYTVQTKWERVAGVRTKKTVRKDITSISADNLRFLARWVKGQRGNTFRHRIYASRNV